MSISIRHRDSGGGGPPCEAGWWRGRRTQRAARVSFVISKHVRSSLVQSDFLQRQRSSASCAPSTTVRSLRELQWSPSPAFAGAESIRVPATPSASGFCRPKPLVFCLRKNKGRRSAEKARLSRGATPRIGCCHPNALRARPRVQRDALAFRRSTAALASAMCRSSIQAALHAMQCAGVTFALASRLSEAPRAPVIMPAGSMPGPPESGSDEPPPAGTAPTPSVGVTG
jgi:hypothetical protein